MSELLSGTLLQGGKYKIEKSLGQGGFGITYLAEQTNLGRKVCIKEFFMKEYGERTTATAVDGDATVIADDATVLSSESTVLTGEAVSAGPKGASDATVLTSVNPVTSAAAEIMGRYREKFVKEARTIAKLDHPGIVRIHDVFEENGTAYYVMDFIEGENLNDLVKREGALSEERALGYIRQVADALSYVHGQRIMHLDVKPANVLVRKSDGKAILIDFGTAKQYDASGTQTSTTPVGLSVGYAPIEMTKPGGVQTFSPETDVYSLGATLYYLVTGQNPPDASERMEMIMEGERFKLPGNISSATADVIEQSMQTRKKRIQTVDGFLELLNSDDEKKRLVAEEKTVKEVEAKRQEELRLEREKEEAEKNRIAEEKAREATEAKRQEALLKEKERAESEEKRIAEKETKKKKTMWWVLGGALIVGGLILISVLVNSIGNYQKVEAIVQEAYDAYDREDSIEASNLFERAAGKATDSASKLEYTYNAGFTAWQAQDWARAKKFFEECIKSGYLNDGETYAKLADVTDHLGDKAGSKILLEQGFAKFPKNQSILTGLINYYLNSGEDTPRLFQLFEDAKRNEPNNASIYYVEGNARKGLGQNKEALAAYEQAIKVDPTYAWGYIGKGIHLYDQAVELQDKALVEMNDAKYNQLMRAFESTLKSCIEPFETAFILVSDNEIKGSIAEYLKNACFRFRNEDASYLTKYNKYNSYYEANH